MIHGPFLQTRKAAKSAGSKRYFTGKICGNGHFAPRLVSSGCCISCQAEYRDQNATKIAGQYRQWRIENADHLRAYHQQWSDENREHVRAKGRATMASLRQKDPKKFAERAREAYHAAMEDPEFRRKASLRSSIQRGKRKAAEGFFTQVDIDALMAAQGGACAACQIDISDRYHIDHIRPIAKGGTNWPRNLQLLCPHCNLSKGAKSMDEFLERLRQRAANDNGELDTTTAA